MLYTITIDTDYVITIDEESNMVRTGIPTIMNANDSIQRLDLALKVIAHMHQFDHSRFSVERIEEPKKE